MKIANIVVVDFQNNGIFRMPEGIKAIASVCKGIQGIGTRYLFPDGSSLVMESSEKHDSAYYEGRPSCRNFNLFVEE